MGQGNVSIMLGVVLPGSRLLLKQHICIKNLTGAELKFDNLYILKLEQLLKGN